MMNRWIDYFIFFTVSKTVLNFLDFLFDVVIENKKALKN